MNIIAITICIIFLWFIVQIKNSLFWLYLWQLKNYHIGRFNDHFRTKRGKKLFLNPFYLFKTASLFLFFLFPALPLILLVLEGFTAIYKIAFKRITLPIFTKKIIGLFFITIFCFVMLFKIVDYTVLYTFTWKLLLINILTPFIVSLIVLIFQPFTFFIRSLILIKARKKRKSLKELTVIGITGSYGKSSTKEFLYTILKSKYDGVKKTQENNNSEIGISKYILENLTDEDKYFICEMGAYNRGGIKLLCGIADPQIGILTGINNQHLSTFGSQENIVKTKFELIDYVKGFSIVNWDNYLIKNFKSKDTYKYSYLEKQDIYAKEIKTFKDHLEFNVVLKDQKEHFTVNVLGHQNISNLLGAIFVASKLNMSLEEISKACLKITEKEGGMIRINNFIDATYSSNANGVMAHLNFLKLWTGKKIIVMPCLIELQKESKRIHEEIGKKIYETCDLAIITTKDNLEDLKIHGKEKIIFENNASKIWEMIKDYQEKEDIILFESRVPEELIKKIKK